MPCRPFCLILFALAFISSLAIGQDRKGPAFSKNATMEDLIKALNSDEFQVREAASKALLQRNKEIIPVLRRALKTKVTLEARGRIEGVLQKLEARELPERLRRLQARIENGEVDAFVDQMVSLKDHLDEKIWQGVLDLVEKTAKKAAKGFRHKPWEDLVERTRKMRGTNFLPNLEKLQSIWGNRLIGPQMKVPETFGSNFIVCPGTLKFKESCGYNIILANGDIIVPKLIVFSIIICDGNVKTPDLIDFSLIIAK